MRAAPLTVAFALVASRAVAAPNDPLFVGDGIEDQWNLMGTVDPDHPEAGVRGIDAEGAWAITRGRPDVVIAILDSGVLVTHEDLGGNIAIHFDEAFASGIPDVDGDLIITLAEAATLVTDLDGDGRVTPTDVRLFGENGIDDDDNGYVDDLIGWDFYEDDNDPTDTYGHGTGRAGIAAAVTDNGIGMAGVCPGCRILPVRFGRTFVAVPDGLAEAIGYAADRGASATVMATGSLGNSEALRAAVRYADEHGVVQCAAIGNEHSRHHHFPQTYEDVIAVAGVFDDHEAPTDWSQPWRGSNFGAHAALAAPTYVFATRLDGGYSVEGGTSSSVPHCGGVAGLVQSRARDLGLSLTPRQVRQIMIGTSKDAPGFDPYAGSGRMNAHAAVLAVEAAAVPPDARIRSPRWYQHLPPGPVPIDVEVAAGDVTTKLELGYGVAPDEWAMVSGATVNPAPPAPGAPIDDVLGDSYAVTIRLTATDPAGHSTIDRRTFFVHADPSTVAGFPLDLGESAEGAPVLADLDGDGRLAVVIATSGGIVHAIDHAGQPALGWPVRIDPPRFVHPGAAAHTSGSIPTESGAIFAGLAAGDLDGDGLPEIVANGLDGKVYAWNGAGSRLAGFPVDLGAPLWASPVLADLDDDGALDVVAATYAREIHALSGAGDALAGFPVSARDDTATGAPPGLVATPAIGDIDGDGAVEIVVATTESEAVDDLLARGRVYAFRRDGAPVAGFPVAPFSPLAETFPVVGSGVAGAPVLADLDGDGALEIIAGQAGGQIAAWKADASLAVPFDHGFYVDLLSPLGPAPSTADPKYEMNVLLLAQPIATDLDGDGLPEILSATMGLPKVDVAELSKNPGEAVTLLHSLYTAWHADGSVLPAFPQRLEGWALFGSSTAADLDGDGRAEIITGSDGGWLHAWNIDGVELAGFPKFTGGWLGTVAAVGDLDGDGTLELVTATREGQLFAWNTGAAECVDGANAIRWGAFHHDARNTGDATAAVDGAVCAGPPGYQVNGGCSCGIAGRRGGGGRAWAWVGVLAGVAAILRRRVAG